MKPVPSITVRLASLFCLTLLALLCVPALHAQTPPLLRLSDSGGDIVTIDKTGTVSCVGSCSTSFATGSPTQVVWSGNIGPFRVGITVGLSQFSPVLSDISLQSLVTGSTGGTLTAEWTNTGYSPIGPVVMHQGSLVPAGSATATFYAYTDTTNVPFGMQSLAAMMGPFTGPSDTSASGPAPSGSPYSITQKVVISMPAGSQFNTDFGLTVTGCTGVIGDFVWSDTNGNGIQEAGELGINGVTVQLYKGAVVPANLVATTVTGPVPPGYTYLTPGTPGYYQFTGQCTDNYNVVVDANLPANQPVLSGYIPTTSFAGPPATAATDSNGSPAAVNLPANDSVNETIDFGFRPLQPLSVTCAESVGQVGIPYSSSIVVTGGLSPYTFSVTPGSLPPGLTLTPSGPNAGLISGVPTTAGTFSFTVTVTDSSGLGSGTVTKNCTIVINPPPSADCVAISNAVQGVPITPVTMIGSGGSGGPYTFSASGLPSGLVMSTSGTISGTPSVSGTFTYTVTITDKDGHTGTVMCSVTVNPAPSATCLVISAVQGVPVSTGPMTGSGGSGGPYTFSATGLPAGLTMAANGSISGTPSASGTFSYTVTITDKDGHTGTLNCSLTVGPPVSSVCLVISAIQGVPVSTGPMTGSGGSGGPYIFSATGLPAGLTMASDGSISGTPSASGTFSYTVTVTDKDGHTGTINCSVTINPPVSSVCLVISAIQGVPVSTGPMTGSGGSGGPYTFSATGLPAGLTMAANGSISGTPSASGTFSYTVTITDKDGHTGTLNCSLTVGPPVSSVCLVISAIQGVPVSTGPMTGSGGSGGPYTFSATGLPAGLTMAANGSISGTPSASGTFSYTVTVTDKDGHTGTLNCSITVNPPVSSVCLVISVIQGVPVATGPMTGSGGSGGPYTFSAIGLPASLTMASDGSISGTPSASGTFSYTVTVTDKDGHTGTLNCSVTVNPPVSSVCLVISAIQGVPVSTGPMTGSGGSGGPYTFSATGLPAGLTMAANGSISGTPSASGTFSYTVTIKDKDGNTGTLNCSLTVGPPVSATCAVINAIQGVAITPVTMTATGGAGAPYTFSATGLPAGLTMSTTGTISGTPTVSGTFSYTVTVKDKNNNTGTVNCSVTVAPPVSATCAVINALQGVAITPVTMTATGGAGAPYTFSATGLPAGLTMSTTGTISGTPTVSGTFAYTVTVKDKNNNIGTINCSVTVTPQVVCVPTTFDLTGNTATTGTNGNIRTFTAPNGVQVKASAWARDKSTGAWATAYLGSYSPGLGVTDSTENGSDPTHKVDNVGTKVNYVMFEFSQPVIVNRAYLDAITSDSDITVWIGTKTNPFTSHITLSDAVLTSLGFTEENLTDLTTARWADINAGGLSGNVVVIAALASDTTAEDQFKLSKLDIACAGGSVGTPSATCVSINATQGTAISPVTLTGTGGAGGPYTFSATGLPAGLTISSTGTISGTPTVSGTFSYTVTIKDKNNNAGTLNCSVTVNPLVVCAPTTFDLTGNTASTGTNGNIRTFTAPNGVQVKASAWARNKTTGAWTTAYLGSYSPGLGVTDNTESGSDPNHKVDNVGTQINYVMFEFSQNVIVNKAFLDSVTTDSDITVWIGSKTNPFTNHITLSDAVLTSLGFTEENLTTLTSARWADINAGGLSGNVLVIAALASDTSAEDQFKISKLDIACTPATPLPTASCVSISATQGVAITPVSLIGAGGTGSPYTFTASGLPAGLTISSSGTISGTPTVSGVFSYIVTIKDKNNNAGTLTCSITVLPQAVCAPSTFDFEGGSSAGDGTNGNIRTFTASNGVQVKASAFSRNKSTGAWSTAFLGSFAPGLGVTDNTESGDNPTHKIDNIGAHLNYVLLEFSSPVVINRAFLESVGTDSDVTVWIGTKTNPFANHITLSDALLSGLGYMEENMTSSGDSRWADINAGNRTGNVIVIAALASDTTAEDEFKLGKLDISCK